MGPSAEQLRLRMVSFPQWDTEGGARPDIVPVDVPMSAATEAAQLRIRVIALENLIIALLAQAPIEQLELAREMAAYISPRRGYTPHLLTLRAADEMRSLVDRAGQFRRTPATRKRLTPRGLAVIHWPSTLGGTRRRDLRIVGRKPQVQCEASAFTGMACDRDVAPHRTRQDACIGQANAMALDKGVFRSNPIEGLKQPL